VTGIFPGLAGVDVHMRIEGTDDLIRLYAETRRLIADEGVRFAVVDGVREGAHEARTNHRFKNRTGRLERGIYGRTTNRGPDFCNGEIGSTEAYSSFVENGTRPHVIRPKEGHGFKGPLKEGQSRRAATDIGTHRVALRWVDGGRTVFARVVHHPGTQPQPFMSLAYFKCERVMLATIERAFAKAAELAQAR